MLGDTPNLRYPKLELVLQLVGKSTYCTMLDRETGGVHFFFLIQLSQENVLLKKLTYDLTYR